MIIHKRKYPALVMLMACVGCMLLANCSCSPEKRKARYFGQGQEAMQKGKHREAVVWFRKALQVDPHYVEAYYRLGLANLKLARWDAAADALEEAASLDPGRSDVHVALGELRLTTGQFDRCETEAAVVLRKEPNSADAYQLLGQSLLARRQFDRALEPFVKLAQLRPQDPHSYTNLAFAYMGLKNFPEAEKNFRKAVEVDPRYLEGVLNLTEFLESEGGFGEAEKVLNQGVEDNPEGVPLYVAWAKLLIAQGKRESVEAVLAKLRIRMPRSVDAAVAIGDVYLQHGNPDRALTDYQRALAIAPGDQEIRKKMVGAYLDADNIQPASDLVAQILERAPKDSGALILQARVLIAQGKAEDGIRVSQQAVREDPSSSQAHYVLGISYWRAGNLGQAKTELMEALKYGPHLPVVLESLAQMNLASGQIQAAQDYAKKMLQLNRDDPAGHVLLGTALARQGQFAQARAEFLQAQKLAPDNPAICLNLAQTYAGEGQWREAEEELQDALKLNPRYTPALAQMTALWVFQKRTAKAVARVQEYLSRFPDDANGHYIMGELRLKSRQYDEAETELNRAIELDPGMAAAYVQLGGLLQKQGDLDAAIGRYQKALSLQPKSAPLTIMLGNLFQAKGDLKKAGLYYEAALAIDSGSGVAANNLAWVYAVQDTNLQVALELAQKAKQILPAVDSVTDTLGWVYYKNGIYSAAIPLLQECVNKSPRHPLYHYHLGMALLADGDKAKGREQLQAALKLGLPGSDFQQARNAIERPD